MAAEFETLGVMPEIIRALEQDLNWSLPTDIQSEAIPIILGGADVMAAAETGSGKTGAFCLPLLQIVWETLVSVSKGNEAVAENLNPRLSAHDRDSSLAISEDGKLCQCRLQNQWSGGRANVGVISGKYYYEVICRDEGLSRIGWSLASASYSLGTDNKGFGFGGTGKKSHDNQFDAYGKPFGKGNVIGCYIDCDTGKIKWSVDGEMFGDAYQIPKHSIGSAWYPSTCVKNAELEFNFGEKPFKHIPSSGYLSILEAKPENTSQKGVGTLESGRQPLTIIIEPSRELAEQTHNNILTFIKYLPPPNVTALLLTGGGQDNTSVISTIKKGVDIITCTIGRVEALISQNVLSLSNIRFFVLDEADKLMEPDNFKSILAMFKRIPKFESRPLQVLMFSATLHNPEIKAMADQICQFPQIIDLKGKPTVPERVDHAVIMIDSEKDTSWFSMKDAITDGVHAKEQIKLGTDKSSLSEGIKRLKLSILKKIVDKYQMDQALIFVRTKVDADNIQKYFRQFGKNGGELLGEFSCACLHAGKNQADRRQSLDKFKKGEVRFLIATDVAARGIDIEGLPYVINFTLPAKSEDYLHRIGRTGRADKIGLAISLVGSFEEKVWYHTCKSKGNNCFNTKLLDEGGCTIWYNEKQLLSDIEKMISKPITVIGPGLELPESVVAKEFGKKEGGDEETKKHLQSLLPVVDQLTALETQAQKSYLTWQLKFRK